MTPKNLKVYFDFDKATLEKRMEIECPGWKNCDCKKDYKKVKFKLPKKYRLLRINGFAPTDNHWVELDKIETEKNDFKEWLLKMKMEAIPQKESTV